MMIQDHTKAENSLDSIGQLLNFQMPHTADSAHIASNMQLMGLQGKAFDIVYMNAQVSDHEKTLALLKDEIQNGSDSKLKSYANANAPIVQMHLTMADSVRAKLAP